MSQRVVKLRVPIQFGTETITELSFRPCRAGDFRGLDMTESKIATDLALKMAERLSGRPSPVIDRLEAEDWAEVREIVLNFIGGSPATGPTP